LFLQRIGVVFVERFDKQRGVTDSRRTVQAVQSGRSLAFFPEGAFTRMPGLLPFRMGAFVAAAEAGIPVAPVTIRGNRSLLRADSRFPRRGVIHVIVAAPILPKGTDWTAAVKLLDDVRASILQHLGEPDLSQTQAPPPTV
jgi:1-acyl-sn-glycerol-3-phosphate acyltransferase